MQLVNVNIDHHDFYCPVTGRQILGGELYEPSPATVMTYLDDVSVIMYADEEMQPKLSSLGLAVDDDAEPEQLETLGLEDNIVCYKISTWGMACGPCSSTVRIFIDMNYENYDEDGGEGKM
jgi:hypothetical protein